MAKESQRRESIRPRGMWGTVDEAVQSGWGAAFRLILVLTTMSALLAGVGLFVGSGEVADILRTLVVLP